MAANSSVSPWQGTALGVLDIIYTVFSFGMALIALMFQGVLSSFLGAGGTINGVEVQGSQGLASLISGLGMVVGVVLIGLGILAIFMARAAFKGQKWSPILSIIFAVLGLATILTNFSTSQLFSLAINLFTLYIAVMCVKSPYFAKAK